MRIIYAILYYLIVIISSPYWLIKGLLMKKHMNNLRERLIGPGRLLPKKQGRPRVWLWALSLGEVLSATNLVYALEEKGAEVIVSTHTHTGREAAKKTWPDRPIFASPMDFQLSTRRFIEQVNPDILVLVETDIWPGILYKMDAYHLPKVLVSARVSDRSLKGYRRIKFFWGKVLRLFDLITAQTEGDRQRLLELGADPEKTITVGNLKFDQDVTDEGPEAKEKMLAELGWPQGRWLVAGSTHNGEDQLILDTFKELVKKYEDLKLLIAPRDKQDFEQVWKNIQNTGLSAARRSWPASSDMGSQVFLLDSHGELARYYELAEIALVGKSWAGPHEGGGHNPLEPAARSKPVLFGPRTQNFRWMFKALETNAGGRMTPDKDSLFSSLDELLGNPDEARQMGENAKNFVLRHKGSLERTLTLLEPFLAPLTKKTETDE